MRVRDGRYAIGHPRSRSCQHHADLPGEHRMRVRHVHGSALVAHVDDSHSALRELIPNRLNVSSLQPEYAVHLARDKKLHDELGNGARCGFV